MLVLTFTAVILTIYIAIFLFRYINIGFKSNYRIGIIKTNAKRLYSIIDYYDKSLNLIFKRKLLLCNIDYNTIIIENKAYILSKGNYWIQCHYIIELNLLNNRIKKYNIDTRNNIAISVNKKYIFWTYCIKNSYIKKCQVHKRSKRYNKEIIVSGICSMMFLSEDNILYAFASDSHRQISNLYIIDAENLNIIKVFDIKDKGYYQKSCIKINNDLYFLNFIKYQKDDFIGEPCNILTKFNAKTYNFKDIKIDYWPRQLVKFKNLIYISYNQSLYSSANNKLGIYDRDTKELNKAETNNNNYHMIVDEEESILYSTDGLDLYRYSLPSLKLLDKVQISDDYDDCFVSSLFLKRN